MAAKKKVVLQKTDQGMLSEAAKAVGTALGKLAIKTGIVTPPITAKRARSPKRTSAPTKVAAVKVRSAKAKAKKVK